MDEWQNDFGSFVDTVINAVFHHLGIEEWKDINMKELSKQKIAAFSFVVYFAQQYSFAVIDKEQQKL